MFHMIFQRVLREKRLVTTGLYAHGRLVLIRADVSFQLLDARGHDHLAACPTRRLQTDGDHHLAVLLLLLLCTTTTSTKIIAIVRGGRRRRIDNWRKVHMLLLLWTAQDSWGVVVRMLCGWGVRRRGLGEDLADARLANSPDFLVLWEDVDPWLILGSGGRHGLLLLLLLLLFPGTGIEVVVDVAEDVIGFYFYDEVHALFRLKESTVVVCCA